MSEPEETSSCKALSFPSYTLLITHSQSHPFLTHNYLLSQEDVEAIMEQLDYLLEQMVVCHAEAVGTPISALGAGASPSRDLGTRS